MLLAPYKNIVVKVGSALVVDSKEKRLRTAWMKALCHDIFILRQQGKNVTIVSSGAIATARIFSDYGDKKLSLAESSAAASEGQPILMQAWREAAPFRTGEFLLTHNEMKTCETRQQIVDTLNVLYKKGRVPIINENDPVGNEEIKFGDNDRLAARVAGMIKADVVILMSDIDGLYTFDPRKNTDHVKAKHIPLVTRITDEIMAMGGDAGSNTSKGGMKSKLQAARMAEEEGCDTIIMDGRAIHALKVLNDNKTRHTRFSGLKAA